MVNVFSLVFSGINFPLVSEMKTTTLKTTSEKLEKVTISWSTSSNG